MGRAGARERAAGAKEPRSAYRRHDCRGSRRGLRDQRA
ncbi:hypothetical protein FM110_01450 [Brachybacterium nesterenkovii]|uniref:Uncharacterized protein n=1 Tax=Brachybacterium nesterenkovii TaxID=47847 RepID=A0A1X6WT81_9MICO|nr:hypothetical protein FM110_01450 [Brachybacterium nesterenkovii]